MLLLAVFPFNTVTVELSYRRVSQGGEHAKEFAYPHPRITPSI